jgi:DsbC/DsbD-like thiol-disulfide interchange protein
MRRLLVALIAVVVGVPADAQSPTSVAWSAVMTSKNPVAAGSTITVRLSAKIASGWHLYSITQGPGGPFPTRIELAAGQSFALGGPIRASAPATRFDPNFNINVQMYDGSATFTLPLRVSQSAAPGPATVTVTARYQVCSATLCMPPHTDTVTVPVTVGPAAGAT